MNSIVILNFLWIFSSIKFIWFRQKSVKGTKLKKELRLFLNGAKKIKQFLRSTFYIDLKKQNDLLQSRAVLNENTQISVGSIIGCSIKTYLKKEVVIYTRNRWIIPSSLSSVADDFRFLELMIFFNQLEERYKKKLGPWRRFISRKKL